jgi:hypothetical protein
MFGNLLAAATRTLGAARGNAMQFLGPRKFTSAYYQTGMASAPTFGQQGGMGTGQWLAGAAKPIATISSLAVSGAAATKALELFANTLLESRESLSIFHGGIAAKFSQLERQEMTLGLRRAQATGAGVERFADAVMKMREDTLQGRILMENLWNSIGTGMATIVSFISQTANPVLNQISEWLVTMGVIEPPNAARNRMQGDLMEFFEQMGQGQFGRPIQQRPGRNGRQ